MDIIKGLQIIGPTLFLKKEKILILGDLHIGQENSMQNKGLHIPFKQYDQINLFMENLLEDLKPKQIIINGDLKHNFNKISDDEWNKITLFLKNLKKYSKLVIIAGNHDNILRPITDKLNIKMKEFYFINKIYICHGDKIPIKNEEYYLAKTIIIGHEHPAIKFTQKSRSEIYKCFIKGPFYLSDEIINETTNKIINETTNKTTNETANETFNKTTNETANETFNKKSNKIINPLINKQLTKTKRLINKNNKNKTKKVIKKTLIVMPSTNPINEGSDILSGKYLSPFLKIAKKNNQLKDFECYVLNEKDNKKPFFFGKIKYLED